MNAPERHQRAGRVRRRRARRATSTGRKPFSASPISVRTPAVLPAARATLVAPMLPLPMSRGSTPRRRASQHAGRNRSAHVGDDDQDERASVTSVGRAVVLGTARTRATGQRTRATIETAGRVGVTGFEPATSASRTQRSASLSYTPSKETGRCVTYGNKNAKPTPAGRSRRGGQRRRLRDVAAHRGDGGGVVGGAEDRRAGDDDVGAGGGRGTRVLDRDAAVDLDQEPWRRAARAGGAPRSSLARRLRDEALAAEARDARSSRAACRASASASRDRRDRRLRVDRHRRRARRASGCRRSASCGSAQASWWIDTQSAPASMKRGRVARGVGDHQVDVERQRRGAPDRLHDVGSDREVRDEVAVHHVEVQPIGAGGRRPPAPRRRAGRSRRRARRERSCAGAAHGSAGYTTGLATPAR